MKPDYLKAVSGLIAAVAFALIGGAMAGVWVWEKVSNKERPDPDSLRSEMPKYLSDIAYFGPEGAEVRVQWDFIRTGESRESEAQGEVLGIMRMQIENLHNSSALEIESLRSWFTGWRGISVTPDMEEMMDEVSLPGGNFDFDGPIEPGETYSASFYIWMAPNLLLEADGITGMMAYDLVESGTNKRVKGSESSP